MEPSSTGPGAGSLERLLDQLGLSPRRVTAVLFVCCGVLTALGAVAEWFAAEDRWKYLLFDLNNEANVPTWYSAGQLCVAALLAWACGSLGQARGLPGRRSWSVVAAALLFVSVDEVAQIHEQVSYYVRRDLHTGGPEWWAWVLPYGAATAVLAVVLFRWWRSLPPITRRRLTIGATVFVVGAAGLEVAEAAAEAVLDGDAVVRALTVVEEAMEMYAVAYVIGVLLAHLCLIDATADPVSDARATGTA
ncbi:MAG: hypothetical protein U0Q03_08880 [Acidimicrobiales bacterium]